MRDDRGRYIVVIPTCKDGLHLQHIVSFNLGRLQSVKQFFLFLYHSHSHTCKVLACHWEQLWPDSWTSGTVATCSTIGATAGPLCISNNLQIILFVTQHAHLTNCVLMRNNWMDEEGNSSVINWDSSKSQTRLSAQDKLSELHFAPGSNLSASSSFFIHLLYSTEQFCSIIST